MHIRADATAPNEFRLTGFGRMLCSQAHATSVGACNAFGGRSDSLLRSALGEGSMAVGVSNERRNVGWRDARIFSSTSVNDECNSMV